MSNRLIDLKPCPFGRGTPEVFKSQYGQYIKVIGEHDIEIYRTPYFGTEEELLGFWNHRAAIAAMPEPQEICSGVFIEHICSQPGCEKCRTANNRACILPRGHIGACCFGQPTKAPAEEA